MFTVTIEAPTLSDFRIKIAQFNELLNEQNVEELEIAKKRKKKKSKFFGKKVHSKYTVDELDNEWRPKVVSESNDGKEKSVSPKSKKTKKKQKPAAKPKQKAQEVESTPTPPDIDLVRFKLTEVAKQHGKEHLTEILKQNNAANVSALSPEQYLPVVQACDAILDNGPGQAV